MKLRALSIRQPYAENILRGHKTIEVRSKPTRIRDRVYIYAGLSMGEIGPDDLVRLGDNSVIEALPRGVLVGTVRIVDCRPLKRADSQAAGFKISVTKNYYAWVLAEPERAQRRLKPTEHPQPVFFWPFGAPPK